MHSPLTNFCDIPRINKHRVPETKNIEEGSAKRNITRKHDFNPNRKEKKQGGGGGGKAKWNKLDDGSLGHILH